MSRRHGRVYGVKKGMVWGSLSTRKARFRMVCWRGVGVVAAVGSRQRGHPSRPARPTSLPVDSGFATSAHSVNCFCEPPSHQWKRVPVLFFVRAASGERSTMSDTSAVHEHIVGGPGEDNLRSRGAKMATHGAGAPPSRVGGLTSASAPPPSLRERRGPPSFGGENQNRSGGWLRSSNCAVGFWR